MCEINMKINFYYANICNHKREKNGVRLYFKFISNKPKEMRGPIFIYTFLKI